VNEIGDKVISVRIDEDTYRKLKIYCFENDTTIKTLIGELVEKELKEKK